MPGTRSGYRSACDACVPSLWSASAYAARERIRFWVVAVGRLPMLLWACSTDPWRVQSHRHLASGGGEIVEIFLPSEIVVS